jgi:hypothetical protein
MPQGQQSIQEMIEAHLEKGVLGLCILALLYAVFHWVLSSPRSVDVFNGSTTDEKVSPGQVDETLYAAAQFIDKRAKDHDVPPMELEDFTERLEWVQNTPFVSDLDVLAGLMLPPELQKGVTFEAAEYVNLAEMVNRIPETTPAPMVWADWTWYQADNKMQETILATAVAPYPFLELQGLWDTALKNFNTQTRVVVASVDVEAESRVPGGNWYGVEPQQEVFRGGDWALPQAPAFDGNNAAAVHKWIETMQKEYQDDLIKPEFYMVYDPEGNDWISWRSRLPEGMVSGNGDELWFHLGALQVGREYRYRYRLNLVNPLFGWPADLGPEDKADAAQATITTPWSDWSDPVAVEDVTRFYITGTNRNENQIKIAVVSQKFGQPVTASFNVSPGQTIGGSRKMTVKDPLTNEQTEQMVSFDTGCVVVSIDFVKQSYRSGVLKETVELVYLSPDGQLYSRIQWVDQDRYRQERD